MAVLLLAAAGLWLALRPRSGSSRVAWSFQPTPSKDMTFRLYPRHDGGVFVVEFGTHFYALDAKGSLINKFEIPGGAWFWKADADNAGGIYVGSSQSEVYAFDGDGKLRWKCSIADSSRSSPSKKGWPTLPRVEPDGLIYAAKSNGEVAVLDLKGKILRRFDAGCKLNVICSPAVSTDGNIYLVQHQPYKHGAHQPETLLAFAPDGTQRWHWTVPGYGVNQCEVAPDGTIFVVPHHDRFYALNPDGTVRWSWVNPNPVPAGDFRYQELAMSASGNAYISSGTRLTVFTPAGKQLLDNTDTGGGPALLSSDGRVYCQRDHPSLRNSFLMRVFWFGMRSGKVINVSQQLSLNFSGELLKVERRKRTRWQLPDSVSIQVGPGVEGEFYGTLTSPGATVGNSTQDIVRIDLVER